MKLLWLRKNNIGKYIIYSVIIGLLFLLIYKPAMLSIDAHHDGEMFNHALPLARGGVLFKDGGNSYGPLSNLIQAFFLKVFGETLWSMRLSAVFFYVLCFIVYYNIFKRFIPKVYVILSQIILLLLAPYWMTTFHAWSSVYALFFMLCSIYFSIILIETEKQVFALLIGLSIAMTFWTRTTCGIVMFIAMIMLCFIQRISKIFSSRDIRKNLVFFLYGILLGIIPFLISFLINGTLGAWMDACLGRIYRNIVEMVNVASNVYVENGILAAATNRHNAAYSGFTRLILDLFPMRGSGIFLILPYATLFIFSDQLYKLFRKENGLDRKRLNMLLVVSLFSLASWHQYFPVSEERHWYWAGFPMFGVLTILLYFLFEKYNKEIAAVSAFGALVALSLTTLVERDDAYQIRKFKYVEEMDPVLCPYLKGIKLSQEQLDFYTDYCELVNYLTEEYPDRRIENRSFSAFLASLNKNERQSIDFTKKPIVVNNIGRVEGQEEDYFLSVEIEQKYPEQELDPQKFTICVHFPMDIE